MIYNQVHHILTGLVIALIIVTSFAKADQLQHVQDSPAAFQSQFLNKVRGHWPPPPVWFAKARMARYLAHNADWGIISSISPEFGYIPFGTLQSFSDGNMDNSTGIPYFYMASISDTSKNIKYNNTVSLSVSQAESSYCMEKELDPEEPTCARLTLAGKVVPVIEETERSFARDALFTRHPAMKSWPSGHDWDFYKLVPKVVYLLDFYGGASHIHLSDYFAAQP